jgi:RNA polymerase sigma factor (TIGR02999 family)
MSDVTQLLDAVAGGDPAAAAAILPLVYDELRQLAAARMANEQPGHTLDATALVHEAYLRLIGPDGTTRYANRSHFFAAAAQAMRRILVDHARRRLSAKRGGGERVHLDLDRMPAAKLDADVMAVDEAIQRLAKKEPKVAELVTLRYFGGLTVAEAAVSLGVSPRTVDTWWAFARAWLAADLGES